MNVNNQQNLNQNNNQLDNKPPPVGNKPQRPQYNQSQPQPPAKESPAAAVEQKENKVTLKISFLNIFKQEGFCLDF